VVHVRKRAFHTRFKKAEDKEKSEKTSCPSEDAQPVLWQSSYVAHSGPAAQIRQTLHCAESKSTLSGFYID
jgi:hypothetical protein